MLTTRVAAALGTACCLLGCAGASGGRAPTQVGNTKPEATPAPPAAPPEHPVTKHVLHRIDAKIRFERISSKPFADLDAALGPPGSTAIADALAAAKVTAYEHALPGDYASVSPDGSEAAARVLATDSKRDLVCVVGASGTTRPCQQGSDPVWLGRDLILRRGQQLLRWAPGSEPKPLGGPLRSLCVEARCKRTSEVVAIDSKATTVLVRDHGHGFVDSSEFRRIEIATGKTEAVFASAKNDVFLSSLVMEDGTACAYRMHARRFDPSSVEPTPAELFCAAAPWDRVKSVMWSKNGAPATMSGATSKRMVLSYVLTLRVIDVDAGEEHTYDPAGLRFSFAEGLADGKTVAIQSDDELGFVNLDDETLASAKLPAPGTLVQLPTKLPRVMILNGDEHWLAELGSKP